MRSNANLIVNNKTTITDVQMIGGQAYAPLRDVAKAFEMQLTKSGNNYKLAPEGGASQVGSKTVRIGQEVFDGRWRMVVNKVERVSEYRLISTKPYYVDISDYHDITGGNAEGEVVKPKKGYLMLAHIRIKNGMKQKAKFGMSEKGNTAIIGEGEKTFAPLIFDTESDGNATRDLLPGSAIEIKILFAVPDSFKPTAIIFTLAQYMNQYTHPEENTDVRILL
jgi:hypothetical protein